MASEPRPMRGDRTAPTHPLACRGHADPFGPSSPARRGEGRARPNHHRGPAKAPDTGFARGKEERPAEPECHNPSLSLLPLIRPPRGGARAANPGRIGGATPGPCTCRSRVPLIGLARLQRALGAVMPPSTQSERRTDVLMLGDAETGTRVTGVVPAATESGYSAPPRGCARAYNLCRTGGRRARVGNPRGPGSGNVDQVVPGRASAPDRRTAQACNGALRGCCAERKCQWWPFSGHRPKLEAMRRVGEMLWNLGPPKPPRGVGVPRTSCFGEALAYCSSRPSRITREALRARPRVAPGMERAWKGPGAGSACRVAPADVRPMRGSGVSRVKTLFAVWSKRKGEGTGCPVGSRPVPKVSKALSECSTDHGPGRAVAETPFRRLAATVCVGLAPGGGKDAPTLCDPRVGPPDRGWLSFNPLNKEILRWTRTEQGDHPWHLEAWPLSLCGVRRRQPL
jgi:hypothetical protein